MYTNSRNRQRRRSPTSNPAAVREPHTVFSVCQPWASPLWLAIRLLASGDVEHTSKQQVICTICNNIITSKQYSFLCNVHSNYEHWVHRIVQTPRSRNITHFGLAHLTIEIPVLKWIKLSQHQSYIKSQHLSNKIFPHHHLPQTSSSLNKPHGPHHQRLYIPSPKKQTASPFYRSIATGSKTKSQKYSNWC